MKVIKSSVYIFSTPRLDIKYNGITVPSAAAAEITVKDSAAGKVVTASGLGLYTAKGTILI